jgi:tetratricopeptide (TPR) repeat protein
MLRLSLATLFIALSTTAARASDAADCKNDELPDDAISACTRLMDDDHYSNQKKFILSNRGDAYRAKKQYVEAESDYDDALALDANNGQALKGKCIISRLKELWDEAIANCTEYVRIRPDSAIGYFNMGTAQISLDQYEDAVETFSKAIKHEKNFAGHWASRGFALYRLDRFDEALSDLDRALAIKNTDETYREWREAAKEKVDGLRADRAEAKRKAEVEKEAAAESLLEAKRLRGEAEAQKKADMAKLESDIIACRNGDQSACGLASASHLISDKDRLLVVARQQELRIAQDAAAAKTTNNGNTDTSAKMSPKAGVVLVIGNSNYSGFTPLRTPGADTRAVAGAFRRLGFTEVIERENLGHAALTAELKAFGDKAAEADWAVVYYAGHGMAVDGQNYLIPVDAKISRVSHLTDETVSLARVMEKLREAKKLRLVILDACRDNPFAPRMQQTAGATRSIGRGLAAIEPNAVAGAPSGVLVAYSARDGQVADDGTGAHSPFAQALLEHLEEPGLELNLLFRKVRDKVMAATRHRDRNDPKLQGPQEPYTYGSLPGEALYFKPLAK